MSVYVSPDQMELALHGDCRCEANHTAVPVDCSVTVTAFFTSTCGWQWQVCARAAEYLTEVIGVPFAMCRGAGCNSQVRRCWAVRPI